MVALEFTERYIVVSHNKTKLRFRIVGSAYGKKGRKSFVLYLRIFPGVPFYIEENWGRINEYIVFSGRETKEGIPRHFCKVGTGALIDDRSAIEIFLPDLRQVYYMRLEPADFHFDLKQNAA